MEKPNFVKLGKSIVLDANQVLAIYRDDVKDVPHIKVEIKNGDGIKFFLFEESDAEKVVNSFMEAVNA